MIDLPLAFAFSAGMVATVNPCGFAMLPAFVSYLLGADDAAFAAARLPVRALRALRFGAAATAGFAAVFAGIGGLVALGGRVIFAYVPLATVGIGLVLIALGVALLLGRALHVGLPFEALGARMFSRTGAGPGTPARAAATCATCEPVSMAPTALPPPGWRTMFLYGVGYAVASLSCTLPIFLAVVGSALVAQGALASLLLFVSYALGMGLVLSAVAVGAAAFKGAVARWLRGLLPYVERASGALLAAGGAYLVYSQAAYVRFAFGG